ncbi:MAG: DMT family transporter [Alphaproteobacteria bacterium]
MTQLHPPAPDAHVRAQRGAEQPYLPILAVAFGAALWGLWWLPLRLFDERGLPGDWAGALAYLAAALLLLPVMLWRWREVRMRFGAIAAMAGVAGLSSAAFNHAIIHGEIVRVTLLFFLTPVWGTLFGAMFLRDPIGSDRAVSIALGIAGAAVVLGYEDGIPLPRSRADWAGLAAGVLWGGSLTLFRRSGEMPAIDKAFANFFGAALCSGAVAALVPGLRPLTLGPLVELWLVVFAVGGLWLVPKVIIELWGASRLDPGRAGIILLLEVVAAAVSASYLSGESVGLREVIGCILVIGAGLVEVRAQTRSARHDRDKARDGDRG